MRAIEDIRVDLDSIPGCRVSAGGDPRRSKWSMRDPGVGDEERDSPNEGSGLATPEFNLPDGLDYSETRMREFLPHKDSEVREVGIEALAWYVSFHSHGSGWGIYIPVSSLAYLERQVFGAIKVAQEKKWNLALELLLMHERFHYAADYGCSQWELLLGRPCWAPVQERINESNTYSMLEEKLANAYMLRVVKSTWSESAVRQATVFVKSQPPGYRDAFESLDDDSFSQDLGDLARLYAGLQSEEMGITPWSLGFDSTVFFPVFPLVEASQCPIHILHDEQKIGMPRVAVRFINTIPSIYETDRFKKQLARYGEPIISKWNNTKIRLAKQVPGHPEFEKLKGMKSTVYSIRVNKSYRAHLRPCDNSTSWEAIGIGPHGKMGHGK